MSSDPDSSISFQLSDMFSIINEPSGATALSCSGTQEPGEGSQWITLADSPALLSLTAVAGGLDAWGARPESLGSQGPCGLVTPACQHITTPAYKQLRAKDHGEPVLHLGPPGTKERNIQILQRTDGRRQHLCRLPDQFQSSCQKQGTFVYTPVLLRCRDAASSQEKIKGAPPHYRRAGFHLQVHQFPGESRLFCLNPSLCPDHTTLLSPSASLHLHHCCRGWCGMRNPAFPRSSVPGSHRLPGEQPSLLIGLPAFS